MPIDEKMKEKAKKVYFDADKREVKSLKEIYDVTTEVQEIFVEDLGCVIQVGHISMKDMTELMAIEDKNMMGLEMLYRLMKSADPKVEKKWIEGLPIGVATSLINALMEEGLGFQRVLMPAKAPSDT